MPNLNKIRKIKFWDCQYRIKYRSANFGDTQSTSSMVLAAYDRLEAHRNLHNRIQQQCGFNLFEIISVTEIVNE